MKKLILTQFAILFAFIILNGQTSLIVGVSGGVNFAKHKATGDFSYQGEDFKRAIRYGGGIDLGIAFGKFSLISGARYNVRGGRSETNLTDPNGLYWVINGGTFLGKQKAENTHSVISVPFVLRYAFGGETLQFFVGAGGALNLMNGKVTNVTNYELTDNKKAGPFENEITVGDLVDDIYKKSHSSIQFNTGFIYKLNDNGNIKFTAIFERSGDMVNNNLKFVDNAGNVFNPAGSIKNGGIALEVGYEHRIHFTAGTKY